MNLFHNVGCMPIRLARPPATPFNSAAEGRILHNPQQLMPVCPYLGKAMRGTLFHCSSPLVLIFICSSFPSRRL